MPEFGERRVAVKHSHRRHRAAKLPTMLALYLFTRLPPIQKPERASPRAERPWGSRECFTDSLYHAPTDRASEILKAAPASPSRGAATCGNLTPPRNHP